ncbi:MAG: hypothetical protein ACK5LY_08285 [Lachnospirales bacterium]
MTEKQNFVEVSKIYNFVEELAAENDKDLIMTNITYYKNINFFSSDKEMVLKKLNDYFKYEKQFRQVYENRRNVEGYSIKLLVSKKLIDYSNRKNLRKYCEKCIELVTSVKRIDDLKYFVSYTKTVGKSYYITIRFIDRLVYKKPLVKTVTKDVWINKNTGKRVSKTYKNAVIKSVKTEVEYKISNKIRFKLIHQYNKKLFVSMMNAIKKILLQYEIKVFQTQGLYILKKKYTKKAVLKNGVIYRVNDNSNQFEGVFKDFKDRAIKVYNMLANALSMAYIDVNSLDIEAFKSHLELLASINSNNIKNYEEAVLDLICVIADGELEFMFPKVAKN